MITARKAGLAMAALFSAIMVAPVLADGAADFQVNAKKGISDLDKISALIDNIHNHSGSASASAPSGGQEVADTEETLKCSVCGMTMTPKPTAANKKAVTIKGKTYYCCAGCDMSKIADKAPARPRAGQRRQPAAPKKP